MIRVGVDVGGTFTDIVLERSGDGVEQQVVVTKVSSTPHDQSEAVVEGILKVAALAGVEPGAFRVRLARGLLRLRETLSELLGETAP